MPKKTKPKSKSDSSPSSFVLFIRRLSFFGIVLTLLALLYTNLGGDLEYLAGTKPGRSLTELLNGNSIQIADADAGTDMSSETDTDPGPQEHHTNKPTFGMNIFRFVSGGTETETTAESNMESAESTTGNATDSPTTNTTNTASQTETPTGASTENASETATSPATTPETASGMSSEMGHASGTESNSGNDAETTSGIPSGTTSETPSGTMSENITGTPSENSSENSSPMTYMVQPNQNTSGQSTSEQGTANQNTTGQESTVPNSSQNTYGQNPSEQGMTGQNSSSPSTSEPNMTDTGMSGTSDTESASAPTSTTGTGNTPPSTPPLAELGNSTHYNPWKNGTEGKEISVHGAVITGPDKIPRQGEVLVQEEISLPSLKNLEGPPVTDFLELFSFDITPDWVEARWSNITIVGPLTTRGYRVPLSTGPTESDLIGSLTYYFNSRLELEKITFEGYTGNLDRLVISLQYFNMSKRVTADPNALLYLSESLADNRRSFLKSYYRLLPIEEGMPMKKYWLTMELYPPER
ncbi:MAG: hypothetical protein Q4C70_02570 [Planctomycetia bacterium]|nr:hypothetical protein [Planctomycetia bacterium]